MIKIIGENYPQVGDVMYWKDLDGEMHDDVCLKIEHKDDPDIATMYFISIASNKSGTVSTFITEDNLVNPLSAEIDIYKKKKAQEKAKEIADYIGQEEIRGILYSRLRKNFYDEDTANHILDILSDYE